MKRLSCGAVQDEPINGPWPPFSGPGWGFAGADDAAIGGWLSGDAGDAGGGAPGSGRNIGGEAFTVGG